MNAEDIARIPLTTLLGAAVLIVGSVIVLFIVWVVMAGVAWLIENWREKKVKIICYPIAAIVILIVCESVGSALINNAGGWKAFAEPKPLNWGASK